jgi:hypothetical protein
MTQNELFIRAKNFRQSCYDNKEKVSFGDSCKVVLLAELTEMSADFKINGKSARQMTEFWAIVKMAMNKPWWKLW